MLGHHKGLGQYTAMVDPCSTHLHEDGAVGREEEGHVLRDLGSDVLHGGGQQVVHQLLELLTVLIDCSMAQQPCRQSCIIKLTSSSHEYYPSPFRLSGENSRAILSRSGGICVRFFAAGAVAASEVVVPLLGGTTFLLIISEPGS